MNENNVTNDWVNIRRDHQTGIEGLRKVQVLGFETDLVMMPYIYPMFSTGNDDANREIFQAESVENIDLVGLAMRGPKKVIDKVIKGLSLHK